jgi:hypothetical protein
MTKNQSQQTARGYEEIAKELEEVAEVLLGHPELNHQTAEKLLSIARDIRGLKSAAS